jgi:biopolymer transport protein ExbD
LRQDVPERIARTGPEVARVGRVENIELHAPSADIPEQAGVEDNIYWNDKSMPTRDELLAHVKAAAVEKPQPEVHIRADKDSRYEAVGRVLYALQRGGIVKVGFLTEPDHGVRGVRQ